MADILYAWSDLEENLLNEKTNCIGYLHGADTPFNEYKERFPDRIWIVRKKDHKLWLLGCLSISERQPSNFPKNNKKHFVYYDPNSSFFFADPLTLQEKVATYLLQICKKSLNGNFQGASASDLIENTEVQKLRRVIEGAAVIPFFDFITRLKNGDVQTPPYSVTKRVSESSVKNGGKDISSPKFPLDPLNRKRRPISPEEDENRRKAQAESGALGEILAMRYEYERLAKLGCPEPSMYIYHVALDDVGAGYDIESAWNGEIRCIEVKASQSGQESFFISSNEVETLKRLGDRGWIYLIDISKQEDLSQCVSEVEKAGERLSAVGVLDPIQFKAKLKG